MLVASYLLSAFAHGTWVSAAQVALFLGVTVLAIRNGSLRRGRAVLAISVVTCGSALLGALVLAYPGAAVQGAANAWKAAVLAFAVGFIVDRVIAQREVTMASIYGAVSAYLVIGLMFAACYGAMNSFGGGAFFTRGSAANAQTFQYFSFTTLTTLGYGDFTAAHNGGRAVAVLEALIGQVFLATLVARLVAAFRGPERDSQRGGHGDDEPGPPLTR